MSGELLPSIRNGLMQTFHLSEPIDLGCLLGCSATVSTPLGHSPGWQAPTQARGVSLPIWCHCLCLPCVVALFSLCCRDHSTTQLCTPPSQRGRNVLADPEALRAVSGLWHLDHTEMAVAAGPRTEKVKSFGHTYRTILVVCML